MIWYHTWCEVWIGNQCIPYFHCTSEGNHAVLERENSSCDRPGGSQTTLFHAGWDSYCWRWGKGCRWWIFKDTESHGISWNIMEYHGMSWNHVSFFAHCGTWESSGSCFEILNDRKAATDKLGYMSATQGMERCTQDTVDGRNPAPSAMYKTL